MKRLLTEISRAAYIGLVVFLAIVLPLSGINAAERQFESDQEKPKTEGDQERVVDQVQLEHSTPDPDEAPENMTPGGPWSEQPAYLKNAPLLKTSDSGGSRLRNQKATGIVGDDTISANRPGNHVTTLASVASDLGRQFTLLGAKPSGTG